MKIHTSTYKKCNDVYIQVLKYFFSASDIIEVSEAFKL